MSHTIEATVDDKARNSAMPLKDENAPLRILIADDQEINRMLAVIISQHMGYSTAVAKNGKEAVHKWERGNFDLILMDIQMPLIDGIEATWIIRNHERDKGDYTPIIACSADFEEKDLSGLTCLGFDGFVSKPLDIDTLISEMNRCIRLKRHRPA